MRAIAFRKQLWTTTWTITHRTSPLTQVIQIRHVDIFQKQLKPLSQFKPVEDGIVCSTCKNKCDTQKYKMQSAKARSYNAFNTYYDEIITAYVVKCWGSDSTRSRIRTDCHNISLTRRRGDAEAARHIDAQRSELLDHFTQ